MQLVSHYLQRPAKARLPSEKNIVPFFDLCVVVQATAIIVHSLVLVNSSKQTITSGVLGGQTLVLQDYLTYKLQNCELNLTQSMDAFTNVKIDLTGTNFLPLLADFISLMRLGMIIGIIAVVVGAYNRVLVELNTFVLFSYRNLVIWKDIVSAVELVLLGFLMGIAALADSPRRVLDTFFVSCGVQSRVSLPFVTVTPLYICAGAGFFAYAVSLSLYLYHTLPKYGVLNEEEIEDYKVRLEKRKSAHAVTMAQLQKTKDEHARLQLQLMEANMTLDDLDRLAHEGGDGF